MDTSNPVLNMDTPATTGSSFVSCRRNIVDIMEKGQQLRCELQTIRHEFLGLLNKTDTTPDYESIEEPPQSNTPILNLLKTASEKLRNDSVAPASTENKPSSKYFDSPDKTFKMRTSDDIKLPSIKRKQFFSSPVLSKMPRLDSCLSCDNLLSDDIPTATPKARKSSRRSSLKKLLSPMRRRSASLDRGKLSSVSKSGAKSRLSIITNGLLFNRNQVDAVDDVPKKSANMNRVKTAFTSARKVRSPADGSESNDSSTKMSIIFNSINDTVKTAELSSDVYSMTPPSTMNPGPTSPKRVAQSQSVHEHSAVTDAIRKVTCNFVTPFDETEGGQSKPTRNNKRKIVTSKPVNRINVSELMSSMDEESFVTAPVKCVSGDTIITEKNIANFSTIVPSNTTNMTLREQVSVCDMTSANILHSTFNYPLHSTMYNPLQCTIANMPKSGDESLELSIDDLDYSSVNNTSDCDSSVLSIDVDTTALDVKEMPGNCYVCKVGNLRREMAQPRLESGRRRAPVGLSQTDIDLESKIPKERPAPIGASQSILDADKTLVNANDSKDETLSATVGSVPNFTALTELDGTLKASATPKTKKVKSSGNCREIVSRNHERDSNVKSSKSRRKSRHSGHDKENQPYGEFNKASKRSHSGGKISDAGFSDFSETPSSLSYRSSSQKRELKRKFKSFNSTVNSSQHTTLAFF